MKIESAICYRRVSLWVSQVCKKVHNTASVQFLFAPFVIFVQTHRCETSFQIS